MIRLRPSGADEVLIKRVRDWYEPGPGVFIEPQSLFSPAMLFTGTTTGAWYDPSDINLTWRRNLLTYTEQFDNAVWSKTNATVTANAAIAPDGTTTADKFIPSAGAAGATCSQAISVATTQYTFTFRAKAAEQSAISLVSNLTGAFRANVFNLSAQTALPGTGWTASITPDPEGNGWFICSCSAMANTAASKSFQISNNSAGWTGDGTSGIYIWGAQLEQGSTVTPYQRITDGIQDYLQYQSQPVLYQDAAGTTPVTAVEQPVGLMLDKIKGLVLGPELVTNGDFSNGATGWTSSGVWTVTGGQAVISAGANVSWLAQFGILTIGKTYRLTYAVTSISSGSVRLDCGSTPGTVRNSVGTYTEILTCTANTFVQLLSIGASTTATVDNISVRELPGNHAFNSSGNSANFPVLSARYNQYLSTETLATQNVTTVAASYKLAFTGTGSITLSGTATGTYSAGTHTITCTAGTLTSTVSGTVTQADLRVANDALNQPAYQRVNTATDYDTVGFKPAEVFDGVDDNLIASAGGGSTTAFFWCSAIRVGKVGAVQTLFSDAGTNTGYRVRINASNQLELSAGNGTAYTTVATTATLSIGQRAVLTAWHDGTNLNVQINNGTVHQAAFATATAGTAQFTIGKDNNAASNFFAGRLYEKVYTKDNAPSSSQITSTKTYVANVAGITL